MNNYRPSATRCFLFLLLAFAAATFFIEVDKTTPWPAIQPHAFLRWWEQIGTDQAAVVILRIVGSGIAGWAMLVGAFGLLASLRPNSLFAGVWRIVTPMSLRRMLAAGVLATALAAPVAATASSPTASAPIILEDLGVIQDTKQGHLASSTRSHSVIPVLSDLGPSDKIAAPKQPKQLKQTTQLKQPAANAINSDTTASRHSEVPQAGEPAKVWLVKPNDHLWKIATDTLAHHGAQVDTAQVLSYWRQLIATNIDQLNDNPDLIYPGQVLTLPRVQA